MIKKILPLLFAGIFFAATQSMALSPVNLSGVTVNTGKVKSVQDIYFDYEEGIWIGAPQGTDKYQDIDKNATLVLPDGKKLAIINHLPYMEVDGKMQPINN